REAADRREAHRLCPGAAPGASRLEAGDARRHLQDRRERRRGRRGHRRRLPVGVLLMVVQQIAEGLWRWAVPHPAWKPEFDKPGGGGWAEVVGCVYAEVAGTIVLIDPLLPSGDGREKFWEALDRDVARTGRVLILVGSVDHGRSADEIAAR